MTSERGETMSERNEGRTQLREYARWVAYPGLAGLLIAELDASERDREQLEKWRHGLIVLCPVCEGGPIDTSSPRCRQCNDDGQEPA